MPISDASIQTADAETLRAELVKLRADIRRLCDFAATCQCGVCVDLRRRVAREWA